jgi:hypothetical protein
MVAIASTDAFTTWGQWFVEALVIGAVLLFCIAAGCAVWMAEEAERQMREWEQMLEETEATSSREYQEWEKRFADAAKAVFAEAEASRQSGREKETAGPCEPTT